jgi:hypothetical protein
MQILDINLISSSENAIGGLTLQRVKLLLHLDFLWNIIQIEER